MPSVVTVKLVEVGNFICDWCPGTALGRLSFIAHSIGPLAQMKVESANSCFSTSLLCFYLCV